MRSSVNADSAVQHNTGWHFAAQLFSRIWPGRDDPFATQMNAMPKLVASRTLTDASAWANSHLAGGDPLDAVTRERRDVIITGSLSIVHRLITGDLVDEYRLLTSPAIPGTQHDLHHGRQHGSQPCPPLAALAVERLLFTPGVSRCGRHRTGQPGRGIHPGISGSSMAAAPGRPGAVPHRPNLSGAVLHNPRTGGRYPTTSRHARTENHYLIIGKALPAARAPLLVPGRTGGISDTGRQAGTPAAALHELVRSD
jgi:hypothetical protein